MDLSQTPLKGEFTTLPEPTNRLGRRPYQTHLPRQSAPRWSRVDISRLSTPLQRGKQRECGERKV